MLIVEIHAETAAAHHAVPTGAGGSAPDVRQGALGGRRARRRNLRFRLRAGLPRPSKELREGGYQGFRELLHPDCEYSFRTFHFGSFLSCSVFSCIDTRRIIYKNDPK